MSNIKKGSFVVLKSGNVFKDGSAALKVEEVRGKKVILKTEKPPVHKITVNLAVVELQPQKQKAARAQVAKPAAATLKSPARVGSFSAVLHATKTKLINKRFPAEALPKGSSLKILSFPGGVVRSVYQVLDGEVGTNDRRSGAFVVFSEKSDFTEAMVVRQVNIHGPCELRKLDASSEEAKLRLENTVLVTTAPISVVIDPSIEHFRIEINPDVELVGLHHILTRYAHKNHL